MSAHEFRPDGVCVRCRLGDTDIRALPASVPCVPMSAPAGGWCEGQHDGRCAICCDPAMFAVACLDCGASPLTWCAACAVMP